MANVPEDLHYSKDHEWVKVEGEIATVGITDHAQSALGDIVYIQLPQVGDVFAANQDIGVVDSVKTSSEIYTPVSGEVIEINENLTVEDNTPVVNKDPYGEGWMVRIRLSNPSEVDKLLSPKEYEDFTKDKAEE